MKTAFICNPSAGWKKKLPLLVRHIQTHAPSNHEIFFVDRALADSMERHLAKIFSLRFSRIVVAGGDGTLNRVVNALRSRGRLGSYEIGVIPVGTCNDFARHLGYRKTNIAAAVKTASTRDAEPIRIARVEDRAFVNNAGFGKRNPEEKRKGPIAVIKEMKPVDIRAEWDGGRLEGQFYMMLCANAPYFSGGLHFSKRSDPSDDLLEFYFVRKTPKIELALRLLFGRARLPLHLPRLLGNTVRVQARELKLHTSEPVAIVADGEPVEGLSAARDVEFAIADACRFILPRPRRSRPP